MHRTNSFITRGLLFVSILLVFSRLTMAQFTADLVQTENGKTTTGKIYFEKPFYRMDLQEQGEDFYVIVDQENKVSRVVRPSQKIYVEMNSTGISSTSNDVFQSIEKQKEMYETNPAGTETINNYECKKYEVLIDSNVVTTFWQSSEFDFPIKVITGKNQNMIMELKNIEEGDIDESYFTIPADFNKVDMPGVK